MHDNYILNNCKYIINFLYDYTYIKYTCFTHNLKTSHDMCYIKADVEILKKSNIANACNHDCNKQSLYKSINL